MTAPEIAAHLTEFVTRELIDDGVEIDASTKLIELGLIDSFSVSVLLAYIGSTYNIEIPLDELTEANLESMNALTELILRVRSQAQPAA